MAMLLGHACMRKITTFSVDSYIYMMVKIRHCDDFTSNIQISVVEPPSTLFQVLVPLHKPADWLMFLSSITGRPTLSFSSWFGIPGNLKVLRNSLVYMCSIPFVVAAHTESQLRYVTSSPFYLAHDIFIYLIDHFVSWA